MIGDSSALIAIIFAEPSAKNCLAALVESSEIHFSAAGFLEASIVVEPVTLEQARIAREAHQRFGKGSGHAAKLNFGDCFAYALARVLDEPLLFVGQDFIHTDIRPVIT